jgi:RimJ/RimL family protein N-acetyltransferase
MAATRPPLAIVALHTERLDLTPLDPTSDAPDLHEMFSDPLVHRFDTDAAPSQTVAETERRLCLQVTANGGTTWAVRLRGGPAIGTIGVYADQGTTIRGVGWSLTRAHWGEGITSEAARAAIPYLLAQDGVDGVEAWVDSRNGASLGVARAAGMSERGRLPRVYSDHVAQTVVFGRAASEIDPEVFGAVATLQVASLADTVRAFQIVLGLHVAWSVPDPPVLAALAVAPWSGSPGFQVQQTPGRIRPGALGLDVGVAVDVVRERVAEAALEVVDEPADTPWSRREMTFRLPEGHLITVSGPTLPPGRRGA